MRLLPYHHTIFCFFLIFFLSKLVLHRCVQNYDQFCFWKSNPIYFINTYDLTSPLIGILGRCEWQMTAEFGYNIPFGILLELWLRQLLLIKVLHTNQGRNPGIYFRQTKAFRNLYFIDLENLCQAASWPVWPVPASLLISGPLHYFIYVIGFTK